MSLEKSRLFLSRLKLWAILPVFEQISNVINFYLSHQKRHHLIVHQDKINEFYNLL